MKLIIGGAYQGKSDYAKENYPNIEIINDFHLIILELIKNEDDALQHIKDNLDSYRNKAVICDDISCGVVPVDPIMRKWRETLGHVLAFLAKESDEVVRVFCGIGTRVK